MDGSMTGPCLAGLGGVGTCICNSEKLICHLEYCNAIVVSLPKFGTRQLQSMLNCAAQIALVVCTAPECIRDLYVSVLNQLDQCNKCILKLTRTYSSAVLYNNAGTLCFFMSIWNNRHRNLQICLRNTLEISKEEMCRDT